MTCQWIKCSCSSIVDYLRMMTAYSGRFRGRGTGNTYTPLEYVWLCIITKYNSSTLHEYTNLMCNDMMQ